MLLFGLNIIMCPINQTAKYELPYNFKFRHIASLDWIIKTVGQHHKYKPLTYFLAQNTLFITQDAQYVVFIPELVKRKQIYPIYIDKID